MENRMIRNEIMYPIHLGIITFHILTLPHTSLPYPSMYAIAEVTPMVATFTVKLLTKNGLDIIVYDQASNRATKNTSSRKGGQYFFTAYHLNLFS